MTVRFIPNTREVVVNAGRGKERVMSAELLADLNTDLGDATREAMQNPFLNIPVKDSQLVYR